MIRTAKQQVVLNISIPTSYPDGTSIPNFKFGKGTTLDASGKCKVSKVLKQYLDANPSQIHPLF